METLTRVTSMVFSDNYRAGERGFSFSSPRDVVGRLEIRLLSSPRIFSVGFSNSISLQQKRIQRASVSSLTSCSETQKHLDNEETQIEENSKTVHVKIQLQKECAFGEQFHIVGDDPIFGTWDPLSAIPMDWSDGHTWTVTLDIPIGKSIQYKFILKGSTGNLLWQPGPDRILQTYETNNTILVSADWDNPEFQMLTEEEPTSITNSETLIVLENLNPPRGEATGDGADPDFHEGDPVLVPGLTAFTTVDAEEIFPSEVNESYVASASLGVSKAEESNLKKETENDSSHPRNSIAMTFGDEEEIRVNEQANEKDLPNSKPFETVVENDMQWGLRTLQKLLTSFDFFQHQTD